MYSRSDLRKILIIRTVQKAVYSLDIVREVISGFENHDISQAKDKAMQALQYIDRLLIEQTRGIASVHALFESIDSGAASKV